MKLILAIAGSIALNASAAITVFDDDGKAVTLQKPALRVIAMAGGNERIIAAVDSADYPEQARRLPRVGSNRQIDMERVAFLKPDLIVVWRGAPRQPVPARWQPLNHAGPRMIAGATALCEKLELARQRRKPQ